LGTWTDIPARSLASPREGKKIPRSLARRHGAQGVEKAGRLLEGGCSNCPQPRHKGKSFPVENLRSRGQQKKVWAREAEGNAIDFAEEVSGVVDMELLIEKGQGSGTVGER